MNFHLLNFILINLNEAASNKKLLGDKLPLQRRFMRTNLLLYDRMYTCHEKNIFLT